MGKIFGIFECRKFNRKRIVTIVKRFHTRKRNFKKCSNSRFHRKLAFKLVQMAANMSHRTLLDKCVAIACITMFTVSLYYWYLYVADSITDPKPPIPAKSSDVYVSAEKIGMLVAHDLKLTSVFQKAILHSDLLSVRCLKYVYQRVQIA